MPLARTAAARMGQAERERLNGPAWAVEILSQRAMRRPPRSRRGVPRASHSGRAMLWLAAFGCLGRAAAGGGWPWLAGAAPLVLLALC